ncbi:uncharacterized protein LOC114546067 [Perca flavescens]|uniref:uncharacterized protein LOC114546067 n=1 Tax=Perca flavescens TaxID=8167 RepID=UPI00106DF875|nr:uncharacterized protein LOC114546067 [Perca flavescens]
MVTSSVKDRKLRIFFGQNQFVSDLMKKCGGRCHVVDNKYWKNNQQDEYRSNQFQVKELLNTIEKMIEANEGSCYTNEMLQAVERVNQLEVEAIRRSPGNMSEEEIREQAKGNVFEKLLIKLAGTATGIVLGALFGVGVSVGTVFIIIRRLIRSLEDTSKTVAAAANFVTAVREIAGAAGGPALVGSAAIISLAASAAVGGVTGYRAAKGADTPQEAMEMAAVAVKDGALCLFDSVHHAMNRQFDPKDVPERTLSTQKPN